MAYYDNMDPIGKGLQAFLAVNSIADMMGEKKKKEELGQVGQVLPGTEVKDGIETPTFSLGKDTFKTQDEAINAQRLAQQGVLQRHGDIKGANEIGRDAQQAKLTGIQLKEAERKDRDAGDIEAIDKKVGDYTRKLLTATDREGKEIVRPMTYDDHLAVAQHKTALLYEGGKFDKATELSKTNMEMAKQKIGLETAERGKFLGAAVTAAANGDYEPTKAFYKKFVPDGAEITNIVDDGKGNLTISRSMGGTTIGDKVIPRDELIAGMRSLDNPEALYNYSQNSFLNNLREREVKAHETSAKASVAASQAQAGLTRAQTQEVNARAEKIKSHNAIQDELSAAIDAGDPVAEAAARKKIMVSLSKGGGAHLPAEQQMMNYLVGSGVAKNEAEAFKMVRTAKEKDPNSMFVELTGKLATAGNMGVTDESFKKATALATQLIASANPGWKPPGAPAATASEFKTSTEAEAALKSGKIKPGDRVMIGGRLATVQ